MSPYLLLIPQTFLMCLGSYISYDRNLQTRPWFVYVLGLLSLATGTLWAITARLATSPRQLFTLSLVWDCVTVAAYSLLPLLVSGVRLSPVGYLGFLLILLGVGLVKWSE